MFELPRTATAPFCPSEVHGSIQVSSARSAWQRWLMFFGPGLLVSVGYMDPGNWATDIAAGSAHGYALLWVVGASSLAAMFLQVLSMRLGLVTQQDLAQMCRRQYTVPVHRMLWIMAEIAIVACDLAEVLGSALALHLLFHVTLTQGVLITAFDTVIVLGLKGKGFRQVEAIVLGLIATMGACFFVQLWMHGPDWAAVAAGFVPRRASLQAPDALYLAVGIVGATVMPHNLYLHSSIVQTRRLAGTPQALRQAVRMSTVDTVASLSLALLINAAILVLAASAFHTRGLHDVADISQAYHLLDPLLGPASALLFGIALLASGQSSTFTGTIAGQILMEGFLEFKMPCWQRRLITRALALLPALGGVMAWGAGSVGKLLLWSQVVLSLQLPFAIYPLLRFTSRADLMGRLANGRAARWTGWAIFWLITAANLFLLRTLA